MILESVLPALLAKLDRLDVHGLSNEGTCGLLILVQLCKASTALSWSWPVVSGRSVVGQPHGRVLASFVVNGNVDQHYRRRPRRICGPASPAKAVRSREEFILAFQGFHHSRLHWRTRHELCLRIARRREGGGSGYDGIRWVSFKADQEQHHVQMASPVPCVGKTKNVICSETANAKPVG